MTEASGSAEQAGNPSSEVVVVATLRVQSGKEDEGKAAMIAALAPTHEEEGCHKYTLHQDLADSSRFIFVERWESEDALDAHMETPHIKALIESLSTIADSEVVRAQTLPGGDPTKAAL